MPKKKRGRPATGKSPTRSGRVPATEWAEIAAAAKREGVRAFRWMVEAALEKARLTQGTKR